MQVSALFQGYGKGGDVNWVCIGIWDCLDSSLKYVQLKVVGTCGAVVFWGVPWDTGLELGMLRPFFTSDMGVLRCLGPKNLRQLCRLTVLCKSCGLWPVWVKLLVRSGAERFCYGLHNKIPALKIFARGWVAQESIFYTINAKIFQGLGPKRRESCNGDRVYGQFSN